MIKSIFNVILLAMLVIAGYFIVSYMFNFCHESAHKAVWASYGVPSNITLEMFSSSHTDVTNMTLYYKNCNDYCNYLENSIDAFGYQIFPFFVLFYLLIVTIIIAVTPPL